jgi:DNA-binding transcriptional MerR regulator
VAQARRTDEDELTVDELAQRTKVPVRTIREYQTLRLLPPPRRQGRIGLYGTEHLERLELVARLQRRGYSLAGIKDLLEAWHSGTNVSALLGVDVGPQALDETPLRLTRKQLATRLPALSAASLRRAHTVGLVLADGPNHYLVRSPALLALAADAVSAGISLTVALDLVATLREDLAALAEDVAAQIVDRIWEPLVQKGRADEIEPLLRRGRVLLLQGAVSMLADRLGSALQARANAAADGGALRAAIDRIRVGAITDAAGHIQHQSRR